MSTLTTSTLVFLWWAWEMTQDFNSQDKSVSAVLETRADINPFRRTDRHHRSDGREVTRLGNTTTCTQCSIVLRFPWQETDFKNDVIEIDSIVTILLPILSVRAFFEQKCCGWSVDSIEIHQYYLHLHINTVVCHFVRDSKGLLQAGHPEQSLSLESQILWIPFHLRGGSWKWWLWSY